MTFFYIDFYLFEEESEIPNSIMLFKLESCSMWSNNAATTCCKTWQPKEVGILTHQTDGDLTQQKRVSQEMFDSIIREVVEEIGVPAASLVSIAILSYKLVDFLILLILFI